MSWYFFGGFSAYWIVPSGRRRNHSGCSVAYGWSGARLERDVEGDLEAVRARGRQRGDGSPRGCQAPDGSQCGRPRLSRWPTDFQGLLLRPWSRCCDLFGSSGRSDGSAAGTAHRTPSRRSREAALRRPRRSRGGRARCVAERGNISYQAPKRASSRSTTTVSSGSNVVGEPAFGVALHQAGKLGRKGGGRRRRAAGPDGRRERPKTRAVRAGRAGSPPPRRAMHR